METEVYSPVFDTVVFVTHTLPIFGCIFQFRKLYYLSQVADVSYIFLLLLLVGVIIAFVPPQFVFRLPHPRSSIYHHLYKKQVLVVAWLVVIYC
jgi:hypothetical protein